MGESKKQESEKGGGASIPAAKERAPPRIEVGFLQGSEFGIRGAGCRVQGAWCRVQGSGCRVQGAGFRVQGAGCRVQGAGCRVQGLGFRDDPCSREQVSMRCWARVPLQGYLAHTKQPPPVGLPQGPRHIPTVGS